MQAINPADGIQVGGIFVHIYFSHTSDVELNFVECWRSRLKVSRREKERGESKKKKTQKNKTHGDLSGWFGPPAVISIREISASGLDSYPPMLYNIYTYIYVYTC